MNTDETKRYNSYQLANEGIWENKCRNCGSCCGASDQDPCEHLLIDQSRGYSCRIYKTRFGARKTLAGKAFNCVPIRKNLDKSWPGDHMCGYKLSQKGSD
ncbi:MAG: hypothetical protein HQL27_02605 [Candidatus Omnitrophica bacterium]|nr:hypothetical protein [Candidatus Omnitrophota bacterium]